jgi:hypothetical protein
MAVEMKNLRLLPWSAMKSMNRSTWKSRVLTNVGGITGAFSIPVLDCTEFSFSCLSASSRSSLEAPLSGTWFHLILYDNLLIILSYFMPVMLEDIGITGSNQQLLMNALNTVFSFLGGIFGSFMVDRLGRRNLFLWATFLTGLCYITLSIIAWKASATGHVSTGTGYAFIAMIFLYGIFYSFGCTCFPLSEKSARADFYLRDSTSGALPR